MQVKQKLIERLSNTVQHNCHIADASHAGDYTLCIYLLKMRELYRWEQSAPFSTNLEKESVGQWLRNREELWDSIEGEDFINIEIEDNSHSPFESDHINTNLQKHQLVYSGGLGINNRPHFFLADLESSEQNDDYTLYVAGKEYARDMSAPPAMSHNNTIYIRKESFRRLLWEKLETWRWNKPDNALGRAFACYDCDNDLDNALNQMTEVEISNVIQHEHGEIQAGKILGPGWEELLYTLPYSKALIMLRAVRDHLADSLTTLPNLLKLNSAPSWHFYFGNLDNMRKDLYPSLLEAYNVWYKTGTLSKIQDIIETGQQHWLNLCRDIIKLNNSETQDLQPKLTNIIENNRL